MKKFYNVGDKVRIVNPMVFQRCGYALDRDLIYEKYAKEIEETVDKLEDIILHIDSNTSISCIRVSNYVRGKLKNAVIGMFLKRENFGGNERKIHEVRQDNIHGLIGTIIGKKKYHTGIRDRGYYSQNYDGEVDYQQPYIDKRVVHCIYTLEFEHFIYPIKIDSINCEKI